MNKGVYWFLAFAGILALSTLYIFVGPSASEPGWLGFPKWIYPFFGIEVLLVLAIYFFTKYYWKSPKTD
jgi:hypothetical protein